MTNAKPADVRAGWALYLANPDISLDDLNRELEHGGFGPVSPRMFGHYRHLVAHGYDRYISINRFDVARAARPYEGASTSARYRYYESEVSVTLIITNAQGVFEARGRAQRVGEVGAMLSFEGQDTLAGLKRAKLAANDYVHLLFERQVQAVVARISEREADDELMLVEVEFARLQPIGKFVDTSAVPTDEFTLLVKGAEPSDRAADLIGRRMYFVLEALESCRAMANEVLDDPEGEHVETVTAPQITQLQLINPLAIDFTAAGRDLGSSSRCR
jgi:hypothetical protein